jgi:soluble lytic murein transglycosylase-like protein
MLRRRIRVLMLGSVALATLIVPIGLSLPGFATSRSAPKAMLFSPATAGYGSHATYALMERSAAVSDLQAQAWSHDVSATTDQLMADRLAAAADAAKPAQPAGAAGPATVAQAAARSAQRVAPPPPPPPPPAPPGSIDDLIAQAFASQGPGAVAWALRVADCESGDRPNAVGPGGYYGLFQFDAGTWRGTPYGGQSWFDASANANAAAWLYARRGPAPWGCR